MAFTPGVYDGVENADYHADPALGSTNLKTLATRTPAHFKWDREHPQEPKDAFDLGTAAHSLILEGRADHVWVFDDVEGWTSPKVRAQRDAARSYGFTPLLGDQWAQVRAMRDAVMADPRGRAAFTGHRPEVSMFTDEDGLMLKARPDALHPHVIVDLKTTVNADPHEFARTGYGLGYYQSAAHYQDVVHAATGDRLPFVLFLVEKAPPHLLSVVEFTDEAMEYGRRMNRRAKAVFRACTESGHWPGYPDVEPLGLPRWAEYKLEETLNDYQ